MTALQNSNANVGGNYLALGAQNYNVRGVGLINGIEDIENVMVAQKDGTPIYVKTLGNVNVGSRIRLGKVGIDDRDDVVEGVVLLQRGYKAMPVLDKVREKVDELNTWKLPSGIKIRTFYDRTALIRYNGRNGHRYSCSAGWCSSSCCSMSSWGTFGRPASWH